MIWSVQYSSLGAKHVLKELSLYHRGRSTRSLRAVCVPDMSMISRYVDDADSNIWRNALVTSPVQFDRWARTGDCDLGRIGCVFRVAAALGCTAKIGVGILDLLNSNSWFSLEVIVLVRSTKSGRNFTILELWDRQTQRSRWSQFGGTWR